MTLRGPSCPFVTVAVTALLSGRPKSRNQPCMASHVWPHQATPPVPCPCPKPTTASPPRWWPRTAALRPYLLGQAVAAAYREAEVLTQDFDHLRLEWRQGHVVVGNLGAAIYPYELGGGVSRVPARPNTPTQRYFPQTGQLLQGDLLHLGG
jgi:hypothetical protein